MESTSLQIEELKKKIEKYREAVESLKPDKREESSQLEKTIERLKEQFDEFRLQQTELVEQMKVVQSFMDALPEGREGKSFNGNSHQLEEKGSRRFQQRNSEIIPSFKALKKLTSETPVSYSGSPSSYQEESTLNRTVNKKNHFKALYVSDVPQTTHPSLQNEDDQIDQPLDHPPFVTTETPIDSTPLTHPEPIEEMKEEPEKADNRPSGFWKGILKK